MTDQGDGTRVSLSAVLVVFGATGDLATRKLYPALARLAEENGYLVDFRVPLAATGYAGPRKRYVLLTQSTAVIVATARYFGSRRYAPSESPTADRELAATRQARA